MTNSEFLLKTLRKIANLRHYKFVPKTDNKGQGSQYYGYVELFDQDANDYVRELLHSNKPCMVSKFGTTELNTLVMYRIQNEKHHPLKESIDFIKGKIPTVGWVDNNALNELCLLSGFFPNDISLLPKYYDINYKALKEIDVLGSYISNERIFKDELKGAKKIK